MSYLINQVNVQLGDIITMRRHKQTSKTIWLQGRGHKHVPLVKIQIIGRVYHVTFVFDGDAPRLSVLTIRAKQEIPDLLALIRTLNSLRAGRHRP